MLNIEFPPQNKEEKMPSLNHSYVCVQILRQLLQYEKIQPLTELTLDIGKGLTPDICVFLKEKVKPNFFRDITRFQEIPSLAIEVLSASQNIQMILEKAQNLIEAGIKAVWTIDPYSRTIFISTKDCETLSHDHIIESEGIQIDFKQVFA